MLTVTQNFRILCYTLVISRIQLALQYAVVLCFTYFKGGYERLVLPLCLNTGVYATSCIIFGAMSVAFLVGAEVSTSIVSLWWVVMFLEGLSTTVISSFWRMLSFKATHLVERMGLLTLIVIGEGAIGITKTVSKLLGKSDTLDTVAVGQIISILLILIFLWALYFDNQPHGHYGTIKQQIWSILHFPVHLAIVGAAEGAQQIAQSRMIIYNFSKLTSSFLKYCVDEHLDGDKLGAKLNQTLEYFQFDAKLETKSIFESEIIPQINLLASSVHQGVCSEANTTFYLAQNADGDGVPEIFDELTADVWTAMFASLGIKLDPAKLARYDPSEIAWTSFQIIYIYWWASLAVLLMCYMTFLYMVRRNKADLSDYVGQATRGTMVVFCLVALGAAADMQVLRAVLSKPYLLPTAACVLALINFSDKLIRQVANRRILARNRPVANYQNADHGSHGRPHYDQIDHDPEKDGDIRGTQLKRQPPLEIVEMDSMSTTELVPKPGKGYSRLSAVGGQKP